MWLISTVVLTALIATALLYVRADPDDVVATLVSRFDRRTDGEKLVAKAQLRLDDAPGDAGRMADLARAYLVRVRETADSRFYPKAGELLSQALALRPDDPAILDTAGTLALAEHEFTRALELGLRANRIDPLDRGAYSILTDAYVELGRYDEAVRAAQMLIDLRPELASLARVSYLRELHGELDGAIAAMRDAVDAGRPTSEATAWSVVQLGNLYFAKGDLDAADRAYSEALEGIRGYVYAVAGKARVLAARGRYAEAAAAYEDAARRVPAPEIVGALGDLYAKMGDARRAEQQYAIAAATQKLLRANGVRVDVDVALFDADHGRDLVAALSAARAEYAQRRSIQVVAALAWIEYRNGEPAIALVHAREALRLGTLDPLLLYRVGVIEHEAGDASAGAALLRRSAELSPTFSLLYADDLAARLRALAGAGVSK